MLWLLLVLYFVATKVNCEDLEGIQITDNEIAGGSVDETSKSIGKRGVTSEGKLEKLTENFTVIYFNNFF